MFLDSREKIRNTANLKKTMLTMKKLFFFLTMVCCMSAVQTALAQNPITTLVHAGNTSVFYGQNSLVDAYTASVNGDYLYLSTGYFTAPAAIVTLLPILIGPRIVAPVPT